MNDQANALRGLMERRTLASPSPSDHSAPHPACQTITVTSGKGGVGKSNIALNLAIALARAEQSVLLMDVNWGIGNLELLCGLNGRWNFSHVITGTRRLDEVLLDGPEGVQILSGVGSLAEPEHADSIEDSLQEISRLKHEFSFVVIDLGTGMHRFLQSFVTTADRVMNITTTEPTAIAETYAILKSLASAEQPKWEVLVNPSDQASQADEITQRLKQTTRVFLKTELASAGSIPRDSHIPSAVASRKPVLLAHPHCPASQSIKQLARRILNQRGPISRSLISPPHSLAGHFAKHADESRQNPIST